MNNYCERAGFATTSKFCFTRREGDSQSEACDYLAVGSSAGDESLGTNVELERPPMHRTAGGADGCSNHPDNQFLVNTRGDGNFEACAGLPTSRCRRTPTGPVRAAAGAGSRAGRAVCSFRY